MNTKTFKTVSILSLSALLVSACGKYEKEPVDDLKTYRENGKRELEKGPEKPQVIQAAPIVVEKEKEVVVQQATIDQNSIVISPDAKLVFTEGQTATFKVGVRSLIPGVKVSLTAKNLPEGASLVKSDKEADIYLLSWTPKLYTIAPNDSIKEIDVKFVANVIATPNEKIKKALEGVTRERLATLQVKHTQALPSDLQIEGLPAEIAEDSITKFQVTVKIPGIDGQSTRKPMLTVFNDLGQSAGIEYLEQDGTRHVLPDPAQRDVQYLGDSKWKFSLLFDAKNITPRPELAKNGQVLTSADGTHLRFNVMVTSPFGTVTPQILKQVKIGLSKPVSAPRFDLSGLAGSTALELTPGETMKLKFFVESGDVRATLKVQLPNISTLAGKPKISCAISQKSSHQDCQLEWAVPCTATEQDLTQDISMSATAIISGRNSEPANQVLKTVKSKKDAVGCQKQQQKPGGATQKPAGAK